MPATVSVRILYLIDGLGMGGAERGLVLHLLHLDRTRFEPTVAILGESDLLAPDLETAHIRVIRLGIGRGPRALLGVRKIARLLRDGDFAVIHGSLVWSSLVGALAGRLTRVKVVDHMVNVDPEGLRGAEMSPRIRRKTDLVAAVTAWVGRWCVDRFVAISEATRDHARWSWMRDPRRVRIVRRGQDLAVLDRAAAQEPLDDAVGGDGPMLLSVGRLYPQKGHRFLVEAMVQVVAQHPSARLLLVGDGPLRGSLERLVVAQGLSENVAFLGLRRDVPALLARTDAFVFPSLWEGQGNAVVEAAALGRPIVASRIAAMEETFAADAAILVPPADAAALASGILQVIDDPAEATAMGERAAASTRERFDIRVTTRALQAVYDEVLA